MTSPFTTEILLTLGPVNISSTVMVTSLLVACMALTARGLCAHLHIEDSRMDNSRVQAGLEWLVDGIDAQIRDTVEADPAPYRAFLGTIFLFVLFANWTSLIPGVEPPTAKLETDFALVIVVFASTVWFGVRANGWRGYLRSFAQPTWVMIPINIVEQVTRSFSLMVRLFGNVMSGVFIVGIILSIAGLLTPIPLIALDLFTGAIQAYIFTILAAVFIGSAVREGAQEKQSATQKKANNHDH
jgi:F-type H+-transporting ATPase subunit a